MLCALLLLTVGLKTEGLPPGYTGLWVNRDNEFLEVYPNPNNKTYPCETARLRIGDAYIYLSEINQNEAGSYDCGAKYVQGDVEQGLEGYMGMMPADSDGIVRRLWVTVTPHLNMMQYAWVCDRKRIEHFGEYRFGTVKVNFTEKNDQIKAVIQDGRQSIVYLIPLYPYPSLYARTECQVGNSRGNSSIYDGQTLRSISGVIKTYWIPNNEDIARLQKGDKVVPSRVRIVAKLGRLEFNQEFTKVIG